MLTLGNWIFFGIMLLFLILAIALMASVEASKSTMLNTFIAGVVALIIVMAGLALYNTHTESGKRSLKTWESETKGGIDRTVTVYDIEGEEIAKYQGRFDVEESSQEGVVKIKFDCDGKRHIIYAQTGTVLIDEN